MYPPPSQLTDARLARRAVAYVRQSSQEQVEEHTGSTGLQLDLVSVLEHWGFARECIILIDEDLGVSGAVGGVRHGFNRLLELTRTGEIGLVAVVDTSRLTRNLVDLAQFATAARVSDVLLWHSGQIVDFRDPISGFLGVFFGADAVRENAARALGMRRAKRRKAEGGLASTRPPAGYVTTAPGIWEKDPDSSVRNAIQLIFDTFRSIGSAVGVARYLRRAGVCLPGKRSRKHGQGWATATRSAVLDILRNPVYDGTYVFGRTTGEETIDPNGIVKHIRVQCPASQLIRIEGHHEPYVSPDVRAIIEQTLSDNRRQMRAPLGRGDALLQGLMRCKDHRLAFRTFYPYRQQRDEKTVRAACYRCDGMVDDEITPCGRMLAARVDSAVEAVLLDRLTPPAVEDLREAMEDAKKSYEAILRQREDELRRADRAVQDAQRAFDQIGDKHPRLKAELANRVEGALKKRESISERQAAEPLLAPVQITKDEIAELQGLVEDLPRLWRHERVTCVQRKAIVRAALERIDVTCDPLRWQLEIVWRGGSATSLEVATLWGVRSSLRADFEKGLTLPQILAGPTAQSVLGGGGAYSSESSVRRMLTRLVRHPRDIELPAYAVIRERYEQGVRSAAIAAELNAGQFPHFLGRWTMDRVGTAIQVLRRQSVAGVGPIPQLPPLRTAVSALHKQGLGPAEITCELQRQGFLSRRRRKVTRKTVLLILWRLGLRPRRPERKGGAHDG